ncbi:MAG: DUF2829 domain-containing protein [archaeon]|nr:DUF2829 domain-containing protein [archaeon]
MAYFQYALTLLKEGNRIKRKSWEKDMPKFIKTCESNNKIIIKTELDLPIEFLSEDILADDWEIYYEEKKELLDDWNLHSSISNQKCDGPHGEINFNLFYPAEEVKTLKEKIIKDLSERLPFLSGISKQIIYKYEVKEILDKRFGF